MLMIPAKKLKINLRSDDELIEKVDILSNKANISRNQWINKALESVILALNFEDEKEIESYRKLSGHGANGAIPEGAKIYTPTGASKLVHLEVYKNCKSKFESLG